MKIKHSVFTILLTLFIVICSIADMNNYNLVFKKNPEPDMLGYKIWFWEGPDTSVAILWPDDFIYIGLFSHDSLVAIYGDTLELVDIYPSEMNGEYLQGAAVAVDSALNESSVSFTKFYKKEDLNPPSQVSFIGGGIKP